MYCKYCGVQTPDGVDVCQTCQQKHANPVNPVESNAPTQENPNFQNSYAQQQPPTSNSYYGAPNGNSYGTPPNPNPQYQPNVQPPCPPYQPPVDYSPASFLLKLACFLFPLVGIILYIVDRTQKPVSAKSCLTAALTSIVLYIVLIILFFILMLTGICVSIF